MLLLGPKVCYYQQVSLLFRDVYTIVFDVLSRLSADSQLSSKPEEQLPSAGMILHQKWATIVHVHQKEVNDRSKILAEGGAVKIRLAGHEGKCVMRKTSLIGKSGFFRAMLSGDFWVC